MDFTQLTEVLIKESSIWLPKLVAILLIIILFVFLSKFIRHVILKVAKRLSFDPGLAHFFAQVSRVIVVLLGMVTALGTVGINVSALVAGLGLTGFAVGFAFKDTLSNILSGVLILLYRPFIIGDKIKIADFEGEVISIDLRYTTLNAEKGRVLIPNSKCFTDPVTVLKKD